MNESNINKSLRYASLIFLFLVILVCGIWWQVLSSSKTSLEVSILNVGQGDAIYIKAPNGNEVVIDGGPDKALLSELGKVLSFFDRTIDMIIVTNPDKDHYAGFIDALDRFNIKTLLEPGTISSTPTYHAFKQKIKEKKVEERIVKRGDVIVLDEEKNIFLKVIFPDRDASGMSSNEGSLVMKLVYDQTCIMLQGDSTSGVEEYIVNTLKEDVSCGLLKAGHHGSRTSTSDLYVKAVSPRVAVISSGKDNRYGHPHPEVIDVLEKNHVEILRTDTEGSISFESDGINWYRK